MLCALVRAGYPSHLSRQEVHPARLAALQQKLPEPPSADPADPTHAVFKQLTLLANPP